jgi:phage baseplate assembly protein W
MADRIFRGYSTSGNSNTRSWALNDIELIKRDLMNHFYTKKGERVMRPDFGCIIWDYFMEQMTPDVGEIIEDEVKRIVSFDTRVSTKSVKLFTKGNGLTVVVDLYYRPFDLVETLQLNFDARQD